MRNQLIRLITGGFLCILGLIFAFVGWQIGRQADELTRLPLLNTTAMVAGTAGQAAVLEGRIAERSALQFQRFVTFERSLYRGQHCDDDNDCEAIWDEVERVTPPLWLDLADGRVRLTNDDYALLNIPTTWYSTDSWIVDETSRYQGFEIGQPVFIVGRSRGEADGFAFEADELYGGTQAQYVASERWAGRIFLIAGVLISFIGGGVAVWCLLARERFRIGRR